MAIRIDGTNTTANPGITGADADTGLVYGTNEVKIVTDATDRVTVTNTGMGIGTASPSEILHVNGTATAIKIDSNGDAALRFATSGTNKFSIYHTTGGTLNFFDNTNSSNRLTIDSSGNVGIGRSNPSSRLHIETPDTNSSSPVGLIIANDGSGADTGSSISLGAGNGFASTAGNIAGFYDGVGTALSFSTSNNFGVSPYSERMRIDSSGNIGCGGITSPTWASDGGIHLGDNYGIGFGAGGSGRPDFQVITAGAGRLDLRCGFGSDDADISIDSSGNVGIGTTSPRGNLHLHSSSSAPRLDFTNGATGSASSDGATFSVDGTSGALNIIQREAQPIQFYTSNTEQMRISSGGKLTAPGVYSGTTTGGGPVYVEADGDLLRYTSSLKYKTDVETIEDSRADAILNCRPVWYRSKCANDIKTIGSEKSDWGWYGFIAEELAEIEPRLVNWATKDAVPQEDGSNKTVERNPADYEAEGVRYENFVPLLLNLIKRQQTAIETLETQNASLEARLTALEGGAG